MPDFFRIDCFQTKCFSCGKKIAGRVSGNRKFGRICPECAGTIKPIRLTDGRKCKKCCSELYSSSIDLCYNCSTTVFSFDSNTSFFYYKDPLIREMMSAFKFKSDLSSGNDICLILKPEIERFFKERSYDNVLITPLSRISQKKRGFNQVEYILKKCGVSYSDPLIRIKHKKHQSELTAQERREWIKGQFGLKNDQDIQGNSVLIIDDIFTTGSTLNEIGLVLKMNNVKFTDTLTFFKD